MNNKKNVDILLVDDDKRTLETYKMVLEKPDITMHEAFSGKEALQHLLTHDVAVILLDVGMPDMDGFETADLIRRREKSKNTPIIFLTGYGKDDEMILKGYKFGAVDYLFKPIVPDILRAKVSVFVELFKKAEQINRQAEMLRDSKINLEKMVQKRNAEISSSRAFLAAILDSTVDAILTVNENGIIQSINKATGIIFGYKGNELLGNNIETLTSDNRLEDSIKAMYSNE